MIFAWLGLVEQRMVLLLLPAMAVRAAGHVLAALVVLGDEGARSPVPAILMAIVLEQSGLPPEVLPVVSIHALSLVVLLVVRAPLCFEVVHVEVWVPLHLLDEPDLQLFGAVSERAIFTVIAFVEMLRILGAELSLVLLWVVHAFYAVVRHEAFVLA